MRSLLAVSLLVSGCAGSPEREAARTWEKAGKYIPVGDNPPVVVFLHGCSGFTPENHIWGDTLSRAGFLVIMPDSFARFGRVADCGQLLGTHTMFQIRMAEIEYAVKQVKAMHPPKMFLMGHSEGGLATQYWHAGGFDGYVISGTTCRYTNLPNDAPTLIVRYTTDPWDGRGSHGCGDLARNRPNTKLLLLSGNGHDAARDRGAQKEVIEFLKGLAASPSLPASEPSRRELSAEEIGELERIQRHRFDEQDDLE